MEMGSLTNKQQCFVQEYLVDLNGTQAAIRAGYSPKTAQPQSARLLSKAMVKAAVEEGLAKRAEKSELSGGWVIRRLRKIFKMAMVGNPVFDKVGCECGRRPDLSAANRALELLGRHLGMFVDRKEIAGPGGQHLQAQEKDTLDLSKLDDDELNTLQTLVKKARRV